MKTMGKGWKKPYPQEMIDFIKANSGKMSDREISEIINKQFNLKTTRDTILSLRRYYGIKGKAVGGRTCPKEMIDFIRSNSGAMSDREISENLNSQFNLKTTRVSIRSLRQRYGIRENQSRKNSQEMIDFIKANSGVMSDREISENINRRFNLKTTKVSIKSLRRRYCKINKVKYFPALTERTDRDGYVKIKNDAGKWIGKQKYLYEQIYGKVPAGHIVIFLDGDKNNFALDNLAVITRNEHLRLSEYGLQLKDPALTQIGIAIAKHRIILSSKINAKKQKTAVWQ